MKWIIKMRNTFILAGAIFVVAASLAYADDSNPEATTIYQQGGQLALDSTQLALDKQQIEGLNKQVQELQNEIKGLQAIQMKPAPKKH
jgi:uncharacterized protein YlxW (UPF0749 family)